MTLSETRKSQWEVALTKLERAVEAAKRSKKGRADLDGGTLELIYLGIQASLNGCPPFEWRDQQAEDTRPRIGSLLELDYKVQSVIHVLAARMRLIDDASPNKTVREKFGVTSQAVQKWVRDEEATPSIATHIVEQAQLIAKRTKPHEIDFSARLDIRGS